MDHPPAGIGYDFTVVVPLLPSHCGGFFVFGRGGSFFFGGFSCPLNGCSIASCEFGALTGDEHTSFYSIVLNQKPLNPS